MAATTKQVVEGALRSIGVLASGEEADAHTMHDALLSAKQMLESWSNESLLVHAQVHEDHELTGSRTITIGTGGDFDTTRPQDIEHLRIRDSGGLEVPVEIVGFDRWAGIAVKDVVVSFPRRAYFEPEYPLAKLYFDAIPESGNTLKMISIKPIAELPELTAEMSFPPGYTRAIRLGLAMELAPEYGKQIDPVMAGQFHYAYRTLKIQNSKTRKRELSMDAGLLPIGGRNYDITHGPGVY